MKSLRLFLLLSATGLCTACTTVKPWDRGHLADYTMRPSRDPVTDSISEHVWFTREAFAGGRGVGGGGCGCN
ncbi:MAG: lipoprotein [Chthoniobacteraceae bacterium]|nr:lipoprotein [Chthoniobacteraceae bacterium]